MESKKKAFKIQSSSSSILRMSKKLLLWNELMSTEHKARQNHAITWWQRVGYTIQIFPSLSVYSDLNCAVWLSWILKCFHSCIFLSALHCSDSVWIGKSKSLFKLARAAMRHSAWNSGYNARVSLVCHDVLLIREEWRGCSCWEFMKALRMMWNGLRKGPCAKVGSP